jgi:uncharacterized repeat protein (TIGR03803 family)
VQGANQSLYGTCSQGGADSDGTVFKINTNGGGFAVLHTFSSQDCAYPQGGLALAGDGSLWGTAEEGGAMHNGAVYKLFAPFENISLPSYGPGGFSLSFSGGVPNQNYQILASGDLLHWESIATVTADANGDFQYVDTSASSHSFRYYETLGPAPQ